MKKSLLLVLCFLNSVAICTAQSLNDFVQSVEAVDMEFANSNGIYTYYNDTLFHCYFNPNDSIDSKYYLVAVTNTSKDTIEFSLSYDLLLSRGFYGMTVNSDFVIFDDVYFNYFFKRHNNKLVPIYTSPKKGGLNDVLKLIDNKYIRGHSNTQNDDLIEKTQTWVEVFDLEKKTRRMYEFPNPSGLEYMYFQPRNLIDFTGNQVFIMDVLEYKIKIYNYNGILMDSIYNPFVENNIVVPKKATIVIEEQYSFNVFTQKVRRNAEVYRKNLFNAKIMCSINLLNDTTLLICWNKPNEEKNNYGYIYDIWKQNSISKKWELFKSNLVSEDKIYTDNEGVFELKSFGISNNYRVFNNTLITKNNFSTKILNSKKYKSWKEFQKLNEDYIKKNDIPSTMLIYKLQY
jgi:hypothetical protein